MHPAPNSAAHLHHLPLVWQLLLSSTLALIWQLILPSTLAFIWQLLFNISSAFISPPLLTQPVEGAHAEHATFKQLSRDFALEHWMLEWRGLGRPSQVSPSLRGELWCAVPLRDVQQLEMRAARLLQRESQRVVHVDADPDECVRDRNGRRWQWRRSGTGFVATARWRRRQ